MAITKITVKIKIAWWFLYFYMPGMKAILWLARQINQDAEPNWERLEYWLKKAIVVKT
jgi:hypothetical protein